jgi:hypothetical protein
MRGRTIPRAPRLKAGLLSALVLSSLIVSQSPGDAIGPNASYWTRPSLWAPSQVYAIMGYEDWGNVAYFLSWDLTAAPDSLTSWENWLTSGALSLEIGYKHTGGDDCNRTFDGLKGSAGFPSGVYIGPDYTEEDDDAVLFIADMDVIAADQRANPGKAYAAWWSCDSRFTPSNHPPFDVQQGDGDRPLFSDSKAHLIYVPAENGHLGFPAINPSPGLSTTTWMFAPWSVNPSFEASDTGWFTVNASQSRICPGASQGSCFLRIQPAGAGDNWVSQGASVGNLWADEGQQPTKMNVGLNTAFQYEGVFRCPSSNPGNCNFDIWLKGQGLREFLPTDVRRFSIPNNNLWHYALLDDCTAGGQTNAWELWINTRGSILDLDTQWVSSDI